MLETKAIRNSKKKKKKKTHELQRKCGTIHLGNLGNVSKFVFITRFLFYPIDQTKGWTNLILEIIIYKRICVVRIDA